MLACEFVCRACLYKNEENKQIEFITEETGFQTLKSVYTELTLLDVYEHDLLPKCLCFKCSELLKQFKSFKETCLQSDLTLRQHMLLNLKEEVLDHNVMLPIEVVKVETGASSDDDDVDDPSFEIEVPEKTHKIKRKRRTRPKYESDESEENIPKQERLEMKVKSETEDDVNQRKRSFKCTEPECGKIHHSKVGLDAHKRMHQGLDPTTCEICNKQLKNIRSLLKHLKIHEKKPKSEKPSETDAVDQSESEEPKRKKALPGQEKYKFLFKCTAEGCRKSYKAKEFLEAHMRVHEGVEPNVCDICHKPLSSIRAMRRHRQIHETIEIGKYTCSLCHKVCVNELALINHTRKHEKGRTCICDVCGLAFYTNSSLGVHKQSHNLEKNFKCQQCPRDFRTNMGLYKHVRKDHTKTNEVHVCRICDKRFPSSKFLLRHCEGTHTVYTTTENVYSCIQCEAKFKNKATLRQHAKLHTGERKYACPICPKTFAHAAILKKHSYFHSGERPVHCEVCDKGFYQKCALDIHMNIHKRQWIAQGVQGITLYEYNRNKKNTPAVSLYTPEQANLTSSHGYDNMMDGMIEEGKRNIF